jgi:hypothetical protein
MRSTVAQPFDHVGRAVASQAPTWSATTFACAVWSQIGAEDGAGALPFNLDDCQHFVDFISLMTDQRLTGRRGSSSE